MGSFLLAMDPDDRWLARLRDRWVPSVSWMPGLVTGSVSFPGGVLAWCVGSRAPLSRWESDRGEVGLLIGDAIGEEERGRLDAEAVARRLLDRRGGEGVGFDGFHVALGIAPGGDVGLSTDHLGSYPVFWKASGSRFVASSNPGAFLIEPAARPSLDLEGLAGLLLIQSSVGGRTLLAGVRRLSPGHMLVRSSAGEVREVQGFCFPAAEALGDVDEDDQVAHLFQALKSALRRHLPDRDPVGLLLTGGRDSRTLAGLLSDGGYPATTLTFGETSDHEARIAARVARKTGFPHRVRPLPPPSVIQGLDLQIRLEHLANGALQAFWWGSVPHLQDLPARTVVGHLFDVVVGGMGRPARPGKKSAGHSYEQAYAVETGFGLGEEALQRLLLGEGCGPRLDGVKAELQGLYFREGPIPQRLWRWMLAFSNRHTIAGTLWRLSFGTWPVVPILDRNLLEVSASLRSSVLANRRAQDLILTQSFPHLAAVPHVVFNADPGDPLRSPLPWRAVRGIMRRLRPKPTRATSAERRFIWRMTDLDGPGWREVRTTTEPLLAHLRRFFDPHALAEFLPGPDQRMPRGRFQERGGRMFLLGLARWLEVTGL